MNAQPNNIRRAWRKFYRITRLGHVNPAKLAILLPEHYARVYEAALQAAAARQGCPPDLLINRPSFRANRRIPA